MKTRERLWRVETCRNGRHDRKRPEGSLRGSQRRNIVWRVLGGRRNLGSTSSTLRVVSWPLKMKYG